MQGWHSGESTRLPPIWPGFDSQTRRRLFPFRKRSLPFETVDAIFSSELHSLGLRTQKVAVTGSCVSLVI